MKLIVEKNYDLALAAGVLVLLLFTVTGMYSVATVGVAWGITGLWVLIAALLYVIAKERKESNSPSCSGDCGCSD